MKYIRLLAIFAGFVLTIIALTYLLYWLAVWTDGVSNWLIPLILFGPILYIGICVGIHDLPYVAKGKEPK